MASLPLVGSSLCRNAPFVQCLSSCQAYLPFGPQLPFTCLTCSWRGNGVRRSIFLQFQSLGQLIVKKSLFCKFMAMRRHSFIVQNCNRILERSLSLSTQDIIHAPSSGSKDMATRMGQVQSFISLITELNLVYQWKQFSVRLSKGINSSHPSVAHWPPGVNKIP